MIVLLASKGIEKPMGMTAQQFVSVVSKQFPEIEIAFARLTQLYSKYYYQNILSVEKAKIHKECLDLFNRIKKQIT
jgi:hypothetical protein